MKTYFLNFNLFDQLKKFSNFSEFSPTLQIKIRLRIFPSCSTEFTEKRVVNDFFHQHKTSNNCKNMESQKKKNYNICNYLLFAEVTYNTIYKYIIVEKYSFAIEMRSFLRISREYNIFVVFSHAVWLEKRKNVYSL